MLSSLEIENFKGIKSGKITDLAQVNVLVGRNNSGKSTVLDALLLMRCAFAVTDYLGANSLERVVTRRIKRDKIHYPELNHLRNARISLVASFTDGAVIEQDWNITQLQVAFTVRGVDGTTATHREYNPGRGRAVDNFFAESEWKWLTGYLGESNAALLAASDLMDPATLRGSFIEPLWERLLDDRRDRTLVNLVNAIYGMNAENFQHTQFRGHNRVVAALPERAAAVDWLGDGPRYAVNMLALGLLLEGTLLMVEEPETHQHPDSLRKLTQVLFELAKQQDLQLFLTTHSWEFMTYALDAAEEKDVALTFHHTRLSEDGIFDTRHIPRPDAKLLSDIGHDIRLQEKYLRAR